MANETSLRGERMNIGWDFLFRMGMEQDILVECSVTEYTVFQHTVLDPANFSAVYN